MSTPTPEEELIAGINGWVSETVPKDKLDSWLDIVFALKDQEWKERIKKALPEEKYWDDCRQQFISNLKDEGIEL